jgi:hypothetical protein
MTPSASAQKGISAVLVLYSDAGHGLLFQHTKDFVT